VVARLLNEKQKKSPHKGMRANLNLKLIEGNSIPGNMSESINSSKTINTFEFWLRTSLRVKSVVRCASSENKCILSRYIIFNKRIKFCLGIRKTNAKVFFLCRNLSTQISITLGFKYYLHFITNNRAKDLFEGE